MAKKKKLTKEQLHEENEKIRVEMKEKNAYQSKDAERIINSLSGKAILAYVLVMLLPPVGIWWMWHKEEDLKLTRYSLFLWTAVGLIILVNYIILIYQNFAG